MTLRHRFLMCLLLPLLGACGDGAPREVSEATLPLAGQTWNFWAFSGSRDDLTQPGPWFGYPVAGMAIEGEGRFTLFGLPIEGSPELWKPRWVLIEVYSGPHLWVQLGSDRLIERIYVPGVGEHAGLIITESATTGYVVADGAGREVHAPRLAGEEPLEPAIEAVHTHVVESRSGHAKPSVAGDTAGVMSEESTWHLLKLVGAAVGAIGGAAVGGALCLGHLACVAVGAVAGAIAGWKFVETLEAVKDFTEKTVNMFDEMFDDEDDLPDLPHRCYYTRGCRYDTGAAGGGVRRVCTEVIECPPVEPVDPGTPIPPLDPNARSRSVVDAGREASDCHSCVNDAAGPGSDLPLDDPTWQQEEVDRIKATCLYRAQPSILWSIPSASLVIKRAFDTEPVSRADDTPAPNPSAMTAGSGSYGPLHLEGTMSHAQGAFTWAANASDGIVSGTVPRMRVTHSGNAHHEPAPPNTSAHSSAGLSIDVRAWARGTPIRTRFEAIPGENTLIPENPVMTGPGTYGTHAGGPLDEIQEGWNSGSTFLEIPRPDCPDIITRYYAVGFHRWDDGLWGSRVTGRELVDRTMSGEVRFSVVGNGVNPPVVSARYEYGAPSSGKPRIAGSTAQTSGSVPVLVFDELYDPDDFPDGPPTGFDRGITGVEYRVVGDGIDPKTPWSDLPPGTYDVEITAWDEEANSTTISVPLAIQ